MTRVKVGAVGLGEAGQVIHLPILHHYSEQFEIAAICDSSSELLAAMGERYNVPQEHHYLDYHEIAAQPDLDAIMVLNRDEYHTDTALAALHQKKTCVD